MKSDPSKEPSSELETASSAPQISEQKPLGPAPKSKAKRMLVAASALFAVVLVIGAVYWFVFAASMAAARVSDTFVKDLQKKEASHAYTLTSDSFQKTTTDVELSSIFESVSPALQGPANITARKTETRNNKDFTVLVYSVKTKEGDKYIRVAMEKINDEWKIINFRSSAQKLEAVLE